MIDKKNIKWHLNCFGLSYIQRFKNNVIILTYFLHVISYKSLIVCGICAFKVECALCTLHLKYPPSEALSLFSNQIHCAVIVRCFCIKDTSCVVLAESNNISCISPLSVTNNIQYMFHAVNNCSSVDLNSNVLISQGMVSIKLVDVYCTYGQNGIRTIGVMSCSMCTL